MIDLKRACQERGLIVAHVKTDSIKIPNATPDDIAFVTEFGKKYGYDFEHEATYDKMVLVNDAVYVALADGKWTAVGKQFQEPYVFKTLFTEDDIEFEDLQEARSVLKGSMCLDFNKDLDRPDGFTVDEDVRFIGRTGLFVPVREGMGGGVLYRVFENKPFAVADTKGYFWKEASLATRDEVDMSYFEKKVDKARAAIEKYTPFEELT